MESIKTLVVGYGLSAKAFHLPFLAKDPDYKVVGIVQPRGNSAKAERPELAHYRSLEEALAASDAELVIISTPNEHHGPMVGTALEAGRHAVVEKPFALTLEEARELSTRSKKRDRVLTVFHNRRWDADFLTLKQLLAEGKIGRPVHFVSRFDRFRPQIKSGWKEEPKPGAGIFYDLSPHLIDQALQLFGLPAAVYADLRKEREEALTYDAFDLYLYYPNMTVHLGAGSLVSAPWPRYSLLGTAGSYSKWGMDPQEAALRQGVLPGGPEWGTEHPEAWGTLVRGQGGDLTDSLYPSQPGNYGQFYAELAAAIRGHGPNPVPAEEALLVMQIMELALQSYEQGKKVLVENI